MHLDADLGPNLMESNESKVSPSDFMQVSPPPYPPWGFRIKRKRMQQLKVMNLKPALKAWTLNALELLYSGPGPNVMNLASAPRPGLLMHELHKDALTAFYSEAPAYGGGGLDLKSWGHCSAALDGF